MKEMKTLKFPNQDEPYEIVDAKAREMASVQPDWSVNDESNPAFIKNRPFYTSDPVEVTVIEEQTVNIGSSGYKQLNSNAYFVEGQTYIVNFNGTSYECVAWYNGSNAVLLGNGDIYGGANMGGDEPFSIDSYVEGHPYLNVSSAGDYTVSVSTMETEIVKIPEKYLPDNVLVEVDILPLAEELSSKQDIITGTQGQIVGFDENGNVVAQDMPSSMPTVTTSDNGKFLRVVDGAWAATTVTNAEEVAF